MPPVTDEPHLASRSRSATLPTEPKPDESSGRDRLASNVLWSWAGHLVFIAAGFVMPRMIDRHLGQTTLGIWDFGWSIVSYFGLAQLGIGASVNRYVAKHRAAGDTMALRRTVSSVIAFQVLSGVVILVAAAVLTWKFPELFGGRLGDHVPEARWVLALLGTALAIETAFDAFRGVITGCHRWDLHNGINSGCQGLTTVAMFVALSAGAGLPTLAGVYLAGVVTAETTRFFVAQHVCPELSIHPRYCSLAEIRTLVVFGGKSLVEGLARLLLFQANSILVVGYLGAAALAVYARALALTRHAEVVTSKLAFVITPAASSLNSQGRSDDLRQLLFNGTRYGAFVALPLVSYLAVMGDPLLLLWMGERYQAAGHVLTILAIGSLLPLIQRPAQYVLIGLNLHGRIGLVSLGVSLLGIGGAYLMMGPLDMGLTGAALAIAAPLSVGNGIFIGIYVCRQLGIPLRRYLAELSSPLACTAPFTVVLLLCRIFIEAPRWELIAGTALGSVVIAPIYWRYALPKRLKIRITDQVFNRRLPRHPYSSQGRQA